MRRKKDLSMEGERKHWAFQTCNDKPHARKLLMTEDNLGLKTTKNEDYKVVKMYKLK